MLDSDMERFIKFKKPDFVGKQATPDQRERGLTMTLVFFEIAAGDYDVRGGEPIFDGESCIGGTTSGAWSHVVKKDLNNEP